MGLTEVNAQERRSEKQLNLDKSIDNCLRVDDRLIKDSVFTYAFNFQLEAVRDDSNKVSIKSINCNDSLGFRLFPDYRKLASLDYSELQSYKKRFRILIPVIVFFKNHDENAKIRVDAALNFAFALYSPAPYNNEKEKEAYFQYRLNRHRRNDFGSALNTIFLPIHYIQIHRIE